MVKGDLKIIDEEEESQEENDNMKNGIFTIMINGEIGWDVTSDSVKEQLEKADGQDVLFEINSPGGAVFDGINIFNAIRDYEGNTSAKINGLAASMASYIPLATDHVAVEDNAIFMIHNAWTIAQGDSNDLAEQAEFLENLNELLSKAYVDKTGKTKDAILKLMDDESWFFGEDIQKEGFADEVIIHKKAKKEAEDVRQARLVQAKLFVRNMFANSKNNMENILRAKGLLELDNNNKVGERNMAKANIVMTTFEEDAVIEKVKTLIEKLEKAESLEAAKELLPELRELIPGEEEADGEKKTKSEEADEAAEAAEAEEEAKPAEEEAEEKVEDEVEDKDEDKSEAEKKLEDVAEEANKSEEAVDDAEEKPEEGEEKVEAPKEEEASEGEEAVEEKASLSDVLDLNDKLIAKLKMAIDVNEKIQEENDGYKIEVEELQTKVANFEADVSAKEQARFEKQFDQVFNKYVTHFSVESGDVDTVKTSMAKFSEAELENIETYIDKKELATMKAEPEVTTKPSSELEGAGNAAQAKQVHWNELDVKEKTQFIFEQVKKIEGLKQ